MQDFEKLGVFYLGKRYDLAQRRRLNELVLYDSKDLVTHAVCFGMTGSGKTGLSISMLEEAAIDGIPAIAIDPKGDLSNLLLTFPSLRGEDFAPWVNEEEARRKGVSREEYAAGQAALWKKGLAEWGEDGARIERLRQAAEFAVYTPGSDAGIPVSALRSFAAPPEAVRDDREAFRERINATATAVLGLLGIEADPLQSREHILLSTILDRSWRDGRDLGLEGLIQQIQSPPVTRVGVLDLESFYPAKERFGLAMALNNLLASPGFESWLEGEPLDIDSILYTPQGKPRIAVFSIAHLNDAERMFFVSLLLTEVVSWMRQQPGATSLRALLYMDEIYGYFPPVANPPSKAPLLTLLKQARAFGLGVMLATQNPADLDYKGLANAGTWFIGRLQTERDKARVLDGLEGASAGAGAAFDRQSLDETLSGLGNRVFLMNNVHEDAPVVFETRWALSYLRGPLTKAQLRELTAARRAAPPAAVEASARSAPRMAPEQGAGRPVLPPDVPESFIPARGNGGGVVYRPMLFGAAEVRFVDPKRGVDEARAAAYLTPITDEAVPVDWSAAAEAGIEPSELERDGVDGACYAAAPPAAGKAKSYAAWSRDFSNWLYGTQTLEIFRSPSLGEVSRPGESERDFRVRIQQRAREERDRLADQLRARYAPKTAALGDRIRRAEHAVAREAEQAQQQKMQTAISIGATLLGAFLGRKTVSASTLGRAGTAARSMSRTRKESQDVSRATENVEVLKRQLAELEAQFADESSQLQAKIDPATEPLETVVVKPKKAGIAVRLVTLAWAPYRPDGSPAWG